MDIYIRVQIKLSEICLETTALYVYTWRNFYKDSFETELHFN